MANVTTPCVLIIEDEASQVELLRYNFSKDGYAVSVALDGEEGALKALEEIPDLIVLDWMLPELSGIDVCRRLKGHSETRAIPVIMLTARGEELDRVRGLDMGADDYVVKPYSVLELLARARALIRRSNPAVGDSVLDYGDITMHTAQHKVMRAGEQKKLGPTEFRLLGVFMARPERVRGLDTGADDYVVKPYSVLELLARARALIRRSNPAVGDSVLDYGDITMHTAQHKVMRAGEQKKLGPTEFRLLGVFMARPERVWSREQLLERVWPHDLDIDLRTVDVHVGRLRRALQSEGLPNPIRTVRAAGYALDIEGS